MGIDPAAGFPLDRDDRQAEKVSDHERRLAVLERGNGIVTVGTGPPTSAITTPFYIDQAAHKAYARDSAGFFALN